MPKIAALAALCAALSSAAFSAQAQTGFLVVAPDRGFLGNEAVRAVFAEYRPGFTAALAIADRVETQRFLEEALGELRRAGAREVVALPLFLSDQDPLLKKVAAILSQSGPSVRMSPSLAGHPLISAILADRVAALSREPGRESLILVAQGADSAENAAAMAADIERSAQSVLDRTPFARHRAVVLVNAEELRSYSPESMKNLSNALNDAKSEGLKPVLVLFDLAPQLDSMMSLNAELGALARRFGAAYDGNDLVHPNLATWLAQESNRRLPVDEKTLGVLLLAHGASERWNRLMLDSLRPLASRYKIEPAFGMADPVSMERAIRRLEGRGAKAIAAVRVFSLEESFRDATEYALGLKGSSPHVHGEHAMPMPTPIRSRCPVLTLGGLEDSPLFAAALFDRARALSKSPERETVFLLAHGAGEERENEHWLKKLGSLASQVQELARRANGPFRDVRCGTWREDWPEKREAAVKKIRAEVQEAAAAGGAIVIPARTAAGGPERELLRGLDYAYDGEGFAPHPKFAQWVESQIRAALQRFNAR